MKIICNKSLFIKNLEVAKKVIDKKTSFEILKCVKLVAKDDDMYIIANNMDAGLYIKIKLQCEVIKEGKCLLDLDTLLINSTLCDGDFLELEILDNKCFINGSNFRSKMNIQDLESYLDDNICKFNHVCSSDIVEFKKMIKTVLPAISKDKTKPILMGALLSCKNDNIILDTIDGYRLSQNKITHTHIEKDARVIIPGTTLKLISQLKNKKFIEISINDNSKYVKFIIDNIEMIVKTIDGEFVDVNKLLLKDSNTIIKINSKLLLNELKKYKEVCKKERNKLIKLIIKDNEIIFNAKNDCNNIESNLGCMTEGDPLEIAFNVEYLIDGLKNINDDIKMTFTTNVNPCLISCLNYKYLLLPVRIATRV